MRSRSMSQIPQEKRYSAGLISLVRCCLVADPERRPTIGQVRNRFGFSSLHLKLDCMNDYKKLKER